MPVPNIPNCCAAAADGPRGGEGATIVGNAVPAVAAPRPDDHRLESSQREFEYLSHWQLEAPVEAVWSALTRVEAWPAWWPHVRSVQTLREGQRGGAAEGLGAIRRIRWSSRLPYGFTLDVEVIESDRARRLCGRATGNLAGIGLWQLRQQGRVTCVDYSWRLILATRWMRLSAPLLAPVFRWNHEGVMHAGARGLADHLGARLLRG